MTIGPCVPSFGDASRATYVTLKTVKKAPGTQL
eukprot:CAMPEP_0174713156 /NCGR_PEP_ID=MMETSP1094-20130205/13930_1 /TAXON_ID=156173 /ORGANISM="Chrysochromulina brevifilum, Strain UTEX LB 985" /LENGTH=32 /DNA_ID= /DNA_START= /DNA_END= /DNA_ORIENTATION=